MTVLIGVGRRMTLAELLAVAHGRDKLACGPARTDDGPDAAAPTINWNDDAWPQQLITNSSAASNEWLDNASSVAVTAVLALHVGHERLVPNGHTVAAQLVNVVTALQAKSASPAAAFLPRDVTKCRTVLENMLGVALPAPLFQRCMQLALTCLAVAMAGPLAQACIPLAALSIDVLGYAASDVATTALAEVNFDVLRPHRTMTHIALALRTILQHSRYSTNDIHHHNNDDDTAALQAAALQAAALTNVPQYLGPAVDDLKQASKTLELELNSQLPQADMVWDDTVAVLATQSSWQAVQVLRRTTQQRLGLPVPENDETIVVDLATAVQDWQRLLQLEADRAVCIVQQQQQQAEQVAAEQKQQQRDVTSPQKAHEKADEFAGMSEAQMQKVLKKRAEKEAKAAAKKAAKEAKGSSVFGAGTVPLVEVLQKHAGLSPDCLRELQTVVDQLLSGGVQRKPKIPKGTRDYLPEHMMIRQQAFGIIRRVFTAHGAVEIDTPVFELKDTLTGKYGEDSKLIYDLADQGGELLALRYDLTVPFARFLALHSVGNIKRFHIGKVYRRDQPALARGRYREFYQCDFDIAGTYGRMMPDAECIAVACDILDALPIGDFMLKLNHRQLLDAILDLCGVPADRFRTICSAVDKLDKEPWHEVKREMVQDKGLDETTADQIGEFVRHKGAPWELYQSLMDAQRFGTHTGALRAMEDLRILFDYLEAMDKLRFVSFDLSLARGLDYYTGVIYEAVCMSGHTQVGSIGGGGRYDNLVSMFQEAGKQTPCVGVSVGIERVFTLMEARLREQHGGSIKQPNVDILVASAGGSMMKEKMKIARILWDAKLSAEFSQQESNKLKKELQNALDREIPFMVIVGEEELAENKCTVKDLANKTEDKVPIADVVSFLRSKGVIPVGCEFAAELLQSQP